MTFTLMVADKNDQFKGALDIDRDPLGTMRVVRFVGDKKFTLEVGDQLVEQIGGSTPQE